MNGPGRQYQHLIWQRDELQPVINEISSPWSHHLLKAQTWAVRCILASPRRQKWRTPPQRAPCRLWTCNHSRSSWDTGPALLTCSCLRSSCRQRTCSYEIPGRAESRAVNEHARLWACFTASAWSLFVLKVLRVYYQGKSQSCNLTIPLPTPVDVWQPARQGEAYVIPL